MPLAFVDLDLFDENAKQVLAREAVFLSQQGLDDLLVTYPAWHDQTIDAVCREVANGTSIVLTVDVA